LPPQGIVIEEFSGYTCAQPKVSAQTASNRIRD